jgi:hypothetical protein
MIGKSSTADRVSLHLEGQGFEARMIRLKNENIGDKKFGDRRKKNEERRDEPH